MVGAYKELMGSDFEVSSVEESLYSIQLTTNTTKSAKIEVELQNGEDKATRCRSSRLRSWISESESYSRDTTIFHRKKELEGCTRQIIKNNTKLRIINYGYLGINTTISLGTDGRSVPSWTCDLTNITIPKIGDFSQWVNCNLTKVLSKIKFHTSTGAYAGTDGSRRLTFRVIEGKIEVPLQDNKKTCPPGKCDYCVDPCRYTEGNTKYDETWCYTKDSWAYCKL